MLDKSNPSSLSATGTIQEIAGRLAEEQERLRQLEASTTAPKERTLFVLGSKCVVSVAKAASWGNRLNGKLVAGQVDGYK